MRNECDTEQILVAPVYQQRDLGECVYDVTLKNRVKGINWNTAVFMGLFHLGAVARPLRVQLEGGVGSDTALVGSRKLRGWHWFPQTLNSS